MALKRRNIIELVILGLIVVVILNFQNLADQVALYTFQPSAEIEPLIEQLGLTPHAKAVLYRARPQLDEKEAFNKDCVPSVGELELGCYNNGRIFVLKIDNASLAPEMTVVLGHELLHAIWYQESSSEHMALGAELEPVYKRLNDSDLNARMADYAKSEPGEEDNELHSILGSEYPTLTPALEAHYATVFNDRTVLVTAETAYASVFTARKAQLATQAALIRSLKAQLSSTEARMSTYRANGQISAYNSLVPNQNGLVQQINAQVDSYNNGVDEYNALSKVLDSNAITPISQ